MSEDRIKFPLDSFVQIKNSGRVGRVERTHTVYDIDLGGDEVKYGFSEGELQEYTPKKEFEVYDEVFPSAGGLPGTIRAICRDAAWVDFGQENGGVRTIKLSNLRHSIRAMNRTVPREIAEKLKEMESDGAK